MALATLNTEQFRRLSRYIETEVGIKMPPAKRSMLESRLQKRLRLLSIDDFESYLEFVFSGHNDEIVHMIDAVTTNKTDFFREPEHFELLQHHILPDRIEHDGWGIDRPLYVWSSACSTGEEPYTLAIVLKEVQRQYTRFRFKILATDISTRVLEHAARGVYAEDRIRPIPLELRKRYFLRSKNANEETVRVRSELRRVVHFHRLNLMDETYPLQDTYNVIFCRNVLIYFERERQIALLNRLHHHLVAGGYLLLGHSESLAGAELPVYSVAPTVYRKPE